MQKNYFLVAVVLSLILMGGIFLRSREQYDHFSRAKDPFEKQLYKEGTLAGGNDRGKLALDKSGHLLVLFADTVGEWAPSKKSLNKGSLFISGSFVPTPDTLPNATKKAPSFPYRKLSSGEILAGKLLIRFGKGSVFLERNQEQKSTRIYADDQEVDVFFEGRDDPFVIPSGMRVTIFDEQISPITAQLYYSKLRKKTEFRLESFIDITDERPNVLDARDQIKKAKSVRQKFVKELDDYLTYQAKTWKRDNDGWFAGLKQFAQSFQQTFDFITLPKRKQLLAFNKKAKPFLDGLKDLEQKNYDGARIKLNSFQETLTSPDWYAFLEKNPIVAKEWETFSSAQRAASQHHKGAEYTVLYDFWFTNAAEGDLSQFRERFSSLQRNMAQSQYQQAVSDLDTLTVLWAPLSENQWEPLEITRYRRLISEIIRNLNYFADQPSSYELLRLLIAKEMGLYDDQDRQDEITLEVTQDLLDFLYRQTANKDLRNDLIMGKLQQVYRTLELETMISNISQNKIFSTEQLRTISLINKVGGKPLTKTYIETLEAKDEAVAITQSQYQKEVKKTPTKTIGSHQFKQIQSTKDLRSYFVISGASTADLSFPLTQDPNYLSFEGLYFNNQKVSGGFHIEGQFFDNVKIGATTKERLSLEEFGKALYQSKLFANKNTTGSNDEIVPQNTAKARFERLLMQQKIKNLGLQVELDDITILDKEGTNFSVENVRSRDQYEADFIYRKSNQSVEKVYLEFGNNTKNFNEPIPFVRLKEVLDEASVENMTQ